jgi:hypothetical protein
VLPGSPLQTTHSARWLRLEPQAPIPTRMRLQTDRRYAESRSVCVGLVKIENGRQIIGRGVPHRQRGQTPSPFNQLQHRRVIERAPRHELPACERRDDQRGYPEAQSPVAPQSGICRRNGSQRRSHVIEKTAPLIERDDQNGIGPRRAVRHSGVNLIEKRFAIADIGVRMVVIRRAAGLVDAFPSASVIDMTVNVPAGIADGNYPFTVTATSQSYTASAQQILEVGGYSVQGPPTNSDWVLLGTTQSIPISVQGDCRCRRDVLGGGEHLMHGHEHRVLQEWRRH